MFQRDFSPLQPVAAKMPVVTLIQRRLCSYLGEGARGALDALEVVDWGRDPWSRGGYSAAPPGAFPARAVLAGRVDRLVFAGEATCSEGEAGTVSGAIVTGERAAAEARAVLGQDGASRSLPGFRDATSF